MAEIPLSRGLVAIVDDEDAEWLSNWRWYSRPSSHATYAARTVKRNDGTSQSIYMHRLILDCPSGLYVDHINRDCLDNRRSNLRICTASQNGMNKRGKEGSVTGVKGVFFDKGRGKYFAAIRMNGRTRRLGTFVDMEEAAKAYQRAAIELFGPFARLT